MNFRYDSLAGATQVGFNRVSGNLLATAHDGDLRIWDLRKGSCPIQYITAHLSRWFLEELLFPNEIIDVFCRYYRIHGINWSHKQETHLTTASQDGTVKYFCINNPRRAEKIITTSSPVWRARYTVKYEDNLSDLFDSFLIHSLWYQPFADGLVTVIVPSLGRGENSLLLWNNARQSSPICSFQGHNDVILDFAWRPNRHYDNSDMELITWSRDQTLRVWHVDESIQKMCEPDTPDDDGTLCHLRFQRCLWRTHGFRLAVVGIDLWYYLLSFPESASTDIIFEGIPIKPRTPVHQKHPSLPLSPPLPHDVVKSFPSFSLQHEFSILNTNIPHVDVEVLDAVKRHAMIRVSVNGHVIMLQVVFSENYPNLEHPPDFIYCQGTSIDDNLAESLSEVLKMNAQNRLRKGKPCLEHCLRALVTTMKKVCYLFFLGRFSGLSRYILYR